MKISFYLIVSQRGTVKTVKNKPGVSVDEVSIKMELSLPDSLFRKPQLTANISVDESEVSPLEITTQMKDNIQEVIQQHTGIPVILSIVNEQPPTK